jgi:hypothetical protein
VLAVHQFQGNGSVVVQRQFVPQLRHVDRIEPVRKHPEDVTFQGSQAWRLGAGHIYQQLGKAEVPALRQGNRKLQRAKAELKR